MSCILTMTDSERELANARLANAHKITEYKLMTVVETSTIKGTDKITTQYAKDKVYLLTQLEGYSLLIDLKYFNMESLLRQIKQCEVLHIITRDGIKKMFTVDANELNITNAGEDSFVNVDLTELNLGYLNLGHLK